jgi:two-component sensor histidine kinase
MTSDDKTIAQVESLLAAPELAAALENRQFRRFLDRIPLAIVISELRNREVVVYANPMFHELSGQQPSDINGKPVNALPGLGEGENAGLKLSDAIVQGSERIGTFRLDGPRPEPALVDAYSYLIEDETGQPAFRLVALMNLREYAKEWREQLERQIRDKDTLLKELQHRVKNNLQIITALIRLEARNVPGGMSAAPFDRLAGRVESLALLYTLLSADGHSQEVDLGVYLSQIASAVMGTHALEGIRLDLKVDPYPASVNIAMPTGLVVNELLTNALKYAFTGRSSGTVKLHSLLHGDGYRVVVEDNGVGLPDGVEWPKQGGLGVLILQTLRENAKASIEVESAAGRGTRVSINFAKGAFATAKLSLQSEARRD